MKILSLSKRTPYLISLLLIILGTASCDLSQMEEPDLQMSGSENQAANKAGANLRIGASLTYEETFEEGGDPFSDQSRQFGADHSFQVVPDPLSSGNTVGRIELRDSDPKVKRSARAEVGFRGVSREKWYSYSVFFPKSGYKKDNEQEIISQWHQTAGGSPPNSLQVKDDKIYLRSINRSDTRDNSNAVYTNHHLADVERGKWNEFVFHFVHSPNSDGLIEIWINKQKIQTIKGPNMRRGFDLPNFKFGIYKWAWHRGSTQTSRRVIYFDNVRIGDERATLADLTSGNLLSSNMVKSKVDKAGSTGKGKTKGESQEITGFNLIQANIDQDLGPISNGAVIESRSNKLNIRANTSSSFEGEIHFKLNGANTEASIDETAPFAVFGDNGKGNYYFGSGLPTGHYTLEATPYSNGKAGITETLKFTIKN